MFLVKTWAGPGALQWSVCSGHCVAVSVQRSESSGHCAVVGAFSYLKVPWHEIFVFQNILLINAFIRVAF